MSQIIGEYASDFSHCAALSRDDAGVLEMRLHTDGGPCRFNLQLHGDLGRLFAAVGQDRANRVVILTATGDRFLTVTDMIRARGAAGTTPVSYTAAIHMPLMPEAFRLLNSFLEIEVPVISAINGPVSVHAEIPVLADIVLATEATYFSDAFHFVNGIVPGDGAHIVWSSLLGETRAKYFLLTGQKISAADAERLGVVNEVIAPDGLLDRARAIAAELAAQSDPVLRGTRLLFTHPMRRRVLEELYLGHAIEGLAGTHHWPTRLRDE